MSWIGVSAASLKKDDVIVDVGGSIGAVTHALYKEMPHHRYVVQDLDKSIEAGKQVSISTANWNLYLICSSSGVKSLLTLFRVAKWNYRVKKFRRIRFEILR